MLDDRFGNFKSASEIAEALEGRREGSGWKCRCPSHDDTDPSLSISEGQNGKVLLHCFVCEQGEVISALRSMGLWPQRGVRSEYKPPPPKPKPARHGNDLVATIWREAVDPRRTLAEEYLHSRNLPLPDDLAVSLIRFHRNCVFGRGTRLPCLIAKFSPIVGDLGPDATPTAILRIRVDVFTGKDRKKALGPTKDQAMKVCPDVSASLGVAEGLETALAILKIGFAPVWALGGTEGLGPFPVLGGIEAMTVFGDNDDSGAGQRAATGCGTRWRRAGREVRLLIPKQAGTDWADTVKGMQMNGSNPEAHFDQFKDKRYTDFGADSREGWAKPSGDPGNQGDDRQSGNGKRRRRGQEFTGLLSSAEFMERWKPPEYAIDGLLMTGSVYTLTGNTNAGKTLLALRMAYAIASGGGLAGKLSKQGPVAIFAGENPLNVLIQWRSLCADLGVDPTSLPVHWYWGTFSLAEQLEQAADALVRLPDLQFWAVDSFQAFFEGEDDNANMAMLDAAKRFRSLSSSHPNRPPGLILAHPTKNASRDQLYPRGGSSVTNELDGNLTLWRDGEISILHWLGKIRGIPFDPIQFEHALVQPQGMVDALGRQMSGPVLRPVMPERAKDIIRESKSRKIRILQAIRENGRITHQEIADRIGSISRATAQREVSGLIDAKWVKKHADKLVLTKEGNEVLDDAI